MRGAAGLAFYNSYSAPTEDSSAIAFERNFNPDMKHDSAYFGALSSFLSCVEKNSEVKGAD